MLILFLLWLMTWKLALLETNLLDQYEDVYNSYLNYKMSHMVSLPLYLGVDRSSGCLCRASENHQATVCFGGYNCMKVPKVKNTEFLKLRTTMIARVSMGDLDRLYFLRVLELDSNHQLSTIEPGAFKNLTNLQQLSISFNLQLTYLHPNTFEGLVNLRNLTMVNNYFTSINELSFALRPSVLPALEWLDVSDNVFSQILKDSFKHLKGSKLKRIELDFCQIDFIHPESFVPLTNLNDLVIGGNDLNASVIAEFLETMSRSGINLTYLDLSAMGFRRYPPKRILEVIANTTIKRLSLAQNQFKLISNDSFPKMENIEVLNLAKVTCISIEPRAFRSELFPKMKALFLNDNLLTGLHYRHACSQIKLLDLSRNTETNTNYFEITHDSFYRCKDMIILNLSFNTIKSIFDYAFVGLERLKSLNLENTTLYYIGHGSFKSTPRLEVLNLANNPLTANQNLSKSMFDGLNELKIIVMKNCGIKYFNVEENIFEAMPNLTHLLLNNNRLIYLVPELLEPLNSLELLDLSDNLFVAWSQPLFYPKGPKPRVLQLTNNKLSHLTTSMLEDIYYLLENNKAPSEIDLRYNIFVCECHSMYVPYSWIEVNGSYNLKKYFKRSQLSCSSPDLWEDRTVTEYFNSLETKRCVVVNKMSYLMWSTPTIILLLLIMFTALTALRYRAYLKYWMFLAKLALGRRLKKNQHRCIEDSKLYKFDAFLSYCNEDRDVVLKMVSFLETTDPYYKLCLYERDFEIGSFISEAILNSINESKFIILVVSDAFAKSQWCRWETQMAEYHRFFLEDGSEYDPLILVKIGDISTRNLSPTLKYLLKTKIYIAWQDQNPDEFFKKLRVILSKK